MRKCLRGITEGEGINEKTEKWKLIVAGLMTGLLLGGTIAVTTPSVAAGRAKVWKQIKKKVDKRYYTKKKADKRYAPKPKVMRGTYVALGRATQGNDFFADNFSSGNTFSSPPAPHVIAPGATPRFARWRRRARLRGTCACLRAMWQDLSRRSSSTRRLRTHKPHRGWEPSSSVMQQQPAMS